MSASLLLQYSSQNLTQCGAVDYFREFSVKRFSNCRNYFIKPNWKMVSDELAEDVENSLMKWTMFNLDEAQEKYEISQTFLLV
jgi:hypothetical protein